MFSFSVDVMYFGAKVECGVEQNEGRHGDKKVVPREQRGHTDIVL